MKLLAPGFGHPNPGCCDHLGSEPAAEELSLSNSASQISKINLQKDIPQDAY